MKLLFAGDSLVAMRRDPENIRKVYHLGNGFVFYIATQLSRLNPNFYEIVNRGNGGSTVLDVYAGIKQNVWSEQPDVITFCVGVNDLYHRNAPGYEVDLDMEYDTYSLMVKETREKLPKAKIMLIEPFVSKGKITLGREDEYEKIKDYAAVIKRVAEENGTAFLPLQEEIDLLSEKYGYDKITFDGIHPTLFGSVIIGEKWLKYFNDKEF